MRSPGFIVCINSVFHDEVATEPSTTTPSEAWAITMPKVERGMVRSVPLRTRSVRDARLPTISQTPKPKASAAKVERLSIIVIATAMAASDTTSAIRSRISAGQSSARFQPRNGPTQSAANSGAQSGTKVALKNGGPTETLLPVSRSRNSG